MKQIPKFAWALSGLISCCVALSGCSGKLASQNAVVDDTLWYGGKIQSVVHVRYYIVTPHWGYSENSETMTGEDWSLVVLPFPDPAGKPVRKDKFMAMTGDSYNDAFETIGGSDLLLHMTYGSGQIQYAVFDPKGRTNISKVFPDTAAPVIFNRSRTVCLTLEGGQAIVYDLLSAPAGEMKILERPAWSAPLSHVRAPAPIGRAILTEDGLHFVITPDPENPDATAYQSAARGTNFDVLVYEANGDHEVWPIPANRRSESFVDAEWVNGEMLLFSVQQVYGTLNMRISNLKGEILRSGKIQSQTVDARWDPSRHEVLCLPTFFEPAKHDPTLPIWNYGSSSLKEIPLRQ